MKKIAAIITAGASVVLLAACSSSSSTSSTSTASSSSTVTTSATSGSYATIIKNGRYKTSKARGIGVTQNSDNMYNLKAFDSGMTTYSKQYFSTKSYTFQEGQYLSSTTLTKWLARKSKSNPTGLNPKSNGSTSPTKRNPMYIQQIGEQDYVKTSNGKTTLAGITIGIGMNRKDYYQKVKYGATYTTTISKAKMISEGKKAAAKILKRLRARGVSSNVPVLFVMFQQAANDSLTGGTVYAYSYVSSGNTISSWKSTSLTSYVFPKTSSSTVPNSNDESTFETFKKKVQKFFPNLAGVTAQALYKNKTLQGLNITVTTQFYSETEISAFTQYLATAAKTYLPSGIKIEITVNGSDGTIQSFLAKSASSKSYYTHVFGAY